MNPPEIQSDDGQAPPAEAAASSSSSVPIPHNSDLTADMALAALKDRDLSPEIVEQISKNATVMKSRKVRFAMAGHPRTPRRLALRLIRELYTFDLMQLSLLPAVAADLKRLAEELLVARLASVTLGERVALARRASSLVSAALLLDREARVFRTALENPRLTEAGVTRALHKADNSPGFVRAVCHHAKWSVRPEVRAALLRNQHTPLTRALEFARGIPPTRLRDILHASRLPEKIKAYLRKEIRAKRG